MTEEELKKKAEKYVETNGILWKIINLQFSSIKEIEKAYIAGAKAMQEENEQLKQQIEKFKEGKQYETCPYRSTDMGCDFCDYRDRNLKDEWEIKE